MPRIATHCALFALSVVAASACTRSAAPIKPGVDSAAYAADTKEWRATRLDAIAGADGWSTLAGLFWLDSAAYTIGSGPGNTIVLPGDHTPARLGSISISGSIVQFRAAAGATVMSDTTRVDSITVQSDKSGHGTLLRNGSVTYRLIERGGRLAIRVKDSLFTGRRAFAGLDYYPLDTSLRVLAKLVPHTSPRTLRILNVIGQTDEYRSPGVLHFTVSGVAHTLTAAYEGKDTTQYFLLFRDSTSRTATYPAGRFMYTTPADSAGYVILDFNRAYNPPCAFTNFATCPLPPAENLLNVAITAGEKRYAGRIGH